MEKGKGGLILDKEEIESVVLEMIRNKKINFKINHDKWDLEINSKGDTKEYENIQLMVILGDNEDVLQCSNSLNVMQIITDREE